MSSAPGYIIAQKHYNFGVEIESVVRPYGGLKTYKPVDWYRQLAEKLRNRDIPAVHDDNSRYSKHPEYYGGKWFVTRDGSLKREAPYGMSKPHPAYDLQGPRCPVDPRSGRFPASVYSVADHLTTTLTSPRSLHGSRLAQADNPHARHRYHI